MDLIRLILLNVEDLPLNQYWSEELPGYTHDQVFYHVEQMNKAGLIHASLFQPDGFVVYDLTPEGHDFIAAARSDTVWNKAKQTVLSNAGTWTLEAMKYALSVIMQQAAHGKI
jgi:hypothetical protein